MELLNWIGQNRGVAFVLGLFLLAVIAMIIQAIRPGALSGSECKCQKQDEEETTRS